MIGTKEVSYIFEILRVCCGIEVQSELLDLLWNIFIQNRQLLKMSDLI